MALNLPFGIQPINPLANLDQRYGPWATCAGALSGTSGTRVCGLTVGIVESGQVVEYWFTGTTDGSLIKKSISGSVATITGATNGLGVNNKNVCLGGALLNNTTLTGAFSLILTGGTKLNTQCGLQISGTTIFDVSRKSLSNINIGRLAGNSTGAGTDNLAIGYQALSANTTGCNNIAIGIQTLPANTNGCNNIANGYQSLYTNTGGYSNIALGYQSLYTNGSGCNNIAIGCQSLFTNNLGKDNIALGICALYTQNGGCNNIAIGCKSLFSNNGGKCNIAIGVEALYTEGECHNIGIGHGALYSNNAGCHNIAIGCAALRTNSIGQCNVAIGRQALFTNDTGSNNIAIGRCAGYDELGSDKLYIANSATYRPLIYGEFPNTCAIIHGAFKTSGATSLLVAPVIGACTDSVLVWNSTDCLIKKVPYLSGSTCASLSTFTITGNSTATGFTVNHAKNKQFVMVQIVRNSTPYDTIYTTVQRPNANCVCVTFDTAPANGCQYKILITS